MKPLVFDIGEIPHDGLEIEGRTDGDFFELPPDDDIRAAGPVDYHLQLDRGEDGLILAHGAVSAPFALRCVRCLEEFPLHCRLDPYFAEFETEPGQTAIDVGGRIREDLLFEVPSYPHCDEGDDADRACPMGAAFETPSAEAAGGGSDAWGALDQLNLGAKKGSND
ncbi:MAG: hypothetical protein KDM91_17655 [Verrucomicrobiae bacterium]|nr:hypothetical protein [Verrucomicrobiae bacterium]